MRRKMFSLFFAYGTLKNSVFGTDDRLQAL